MSIKAPEHLTRQTHPILDIPARWSEVSQRPAFDAVGYQERIGAIVGKAFDAPIVNLRWAPEVVEPQFGILKKRYVSHWDDEGEKVSPPRWVFEERYEPHQYFEGWEAGRYVTDPTNGERLDRGAPPREGWYAFMYLVAEHDDHCCERANADSQRRCWGYYRTPNDADLDKLRRAMQLSEADKLVRPQAVLSSEDLETIARAANYDAAELRAKVSSIVDQVYDDFMNTHGHRLASHDETLWRKGRYHFLADNHEPLQPSGYKETPSGILTPSDD